MGTILAVFDLQDNLMLPTKSIGLTGQMQKRKQIFMMAAMEEVTPMLPTMFQVNWPFGSGEK